MSIPLLLFLAKPVLYLAAFIVAALSFKAYGPHSRLPAWLSVLLATLSRLALGLVTLPLMVLDWVDGTTYMVLVLLVGFVLWGLVAKLFFRRASWGKILIFSLCAEAISGGVDVATYRDMRDFRMCHGKQAIPSPFELVS